MQHIPEPVSCSDAKEPDKKKKGQRDELSSVLTYNIGHNKYR